MGAGCRINEATLSASRFLPAPLMIVVSACRLGRIAPGYESETNRLAALRLVRVRLRLRPYQSTT
jgi:hypothetical protein